MANIGETKREIVVEPIPAPVTTPEPVVAPAEPAPAEKEPVPA